MFHVVTLHDVTVQMFIIHRERERERDYAVWRICIGSVRYSICIHCSLSKFSGNSLGVTDEKLTPIFRQFLSYFTGVKVRNLASIFNTNRFESPSLRNGTTFLKSKMNLETPMIGRIVGPIQPTQYSSVHSSLRNWGYKFAPPLKYGPGKFVESSITQPCIAQFC